MKSRLLYLALRLACISVILFTACAKKPRPENDPEEKEFEKAVENLTTVATSIDSFYLESDSVEDMAAKIDEIKAVEGVEDAYATSTCLYVKIDGWGTVGYPFDYDDGETIYNSSVLEPLKQFAANVSTKAVSEEYLPKSDKYTVYILNATHSEMKGDAEIAANATQEMFEVCGFRVKYEPYPKPDCFSDDIFDYDLIFIIGHGVYDDVTDSHWVETTETFRVYNENTMDGVDGMFVGNDVLRVYRTKGSRDSQDGIIFQTYVSEQFIKDASKRFAQDGKSVIFMVPCQNLKGSKNMKMDDGRMINDNLAQVFFDKGAGLYIGYDESSNFLASFGGMNFFANLLSGYSFREAIDRMPNSDSDYALNEQRNAVVDPNPDATYLFWHRVNRNKKGKVIREWDVARHVLLSPKGFQMDAFIVSPRMTSADPLEDSYAFSACAYCSPDVEVMYEDNSDSNFSYSFLQEEDRQPEYGFAISQGSDPAAGIRYPASVTRDPRQHLIEYQISLPVSNLEAGKEYHVWPYIAIGRDCNYGEPDVFTTQVVWSGDIEDTEHKPWN